MIQTMSSQEQTLPTRPPMMPMASKAGERGATAASYETEMQEIAASSTVTMDRLKAAEDESGGLSSIGASFLTLVDPSGAARRRLWTKADFLHLHAVSGGYFIFLGLPWLIWSHVVSCLDTSIAMERSSWFLASLMLAGLLNALSAIPMSRFASNDFFDLRDLKANGFTFGGSGLTIMCLWMAWWYSGAYPDWLQPLNWPFFALWTAVVVGTTANWELMLQQDFESNERSGRKFAKVSPEEMAQKRVLYRVASWPNLTQLLFMFSIPYGGLAWLETVTNRWPMQETAMFHYSLASALGYALSMFSETLRDRKLVSLKVDLYILLITFIFPMVSFFADGLIYGGDNVSVLVFQNWALFNLGGLPFDGPFSSLT